MIEAFFRSMKNNYLYNHRLLDIGPVEKLVSFYVDQHNMVIPHAAFRGATPYEMFTGKWHMQEELALRSKFRSAVSARVATNQIAASCGNCDSMNESPECEAP